MLLKLTVQTALWLTLMAALLLVPAGTLAWQQAWVFVIVIGGASLLLCAWLVVHDPALLEQRMAGPLQGDQPRWDRIFMICLMALFVLWLVVMGLDRRFGWSHVPLWLEVVGALGVLGAYYVFWLVFRANSFAAPVVKIQQERGHAIVTTGPYAVVRHPMYAGAIGFVLGTPLLLGSWPGVALGLVMFLAFGYRAVREEATLAAQLPDYADYAARVRYRFFPHIW